ncbi:hypothetical protein K474DRAFT_981395 [Panus rudis PR-1116 ss-1]|nr:hypothetical protein K474DRAFT_981395 [Panus rudis PR-1116 ss-1]
MINCMFIPGRSRITVYHCTLSVAVVFLRYIPPTSFRKTTDHKHQWQTNGGGGGFYSTLAITSIEERPQRSQPRASSRSMQSASKFSSFNTRQPIYLLRSSVREQNAPHTMDEHHHSTLIAPIVYSADPRSRQ